MTEFATSRKKRQSSREFTSPLSWRHPNEASYENQKNLQVIRTGDPSVNIGGPFPTIPRELLGDSRLLYETWNRFWGYRLAAAASTPYQTLGQGGNYPEILSTFPGHIVPGMSGGERKVGGLAIERFKNILYRQLRGPLPPVGLFSEEHNERLKVEVIDEPTVKESDVSLWVDQDCFWPDGTDWPWIINQPRLKRITLSDVTNYHRQIDAEMILMSWLEREAVTFINRGMVREVLSLIRRVWTPHTKEHIFAPETIMAARIVIDQMKINSRKEKRNWLALAFELEAVLSHIEYSWNFNVTGCGKHGGAWVEVGRLPIAAIKSAELVVPERILTELVSIRINGFAPIVVNEYKCNTDGTHRQTAAWIWNLLEFSLESFPRGIWTGCPLDKAWFQEAVQEFVSRYGRDMGPIVTREALRSLALILRNQEMKPVLWREVIPYIKEYHPITHLPVILLPEYSCGAVIKGPYDSGEGSYRVDPLVYETLVNNPDYVLPARGPYHLTDRALLPWFKILEKR